MKGKTDGKSYGQSFTFKRKRPREFQKAKKIYKKNRVNSSRAVDAEIAELERRLAEGVVDSSKVSHFTDFPLCKKTLDGLKDAKYTVPTEIQRESIMLALQGKDILGAAKTGSGKTLAFLIPVLETLFKSKWSAMDGMGALIISPTRELAYQTFEVLKKIGRHHDFSAGLVIGGKFLREEAAQINRTNIVVCTPGRLLQHMDETYNFNADGLQILVLDEADRILDMGFAKTMNAIIANLPPERQTLLFSATQTKSIKDLARLSLRDPMYVSVHEHAAHSTPARLEQSYIVCELHEKLSMLWSFLKNHLHSKILVFLTCCKQVRYVHEVMRRLRPGMTVLCLHGGMNQLKRVAVYDEFCRKEHVVLFATDIASRGLDFPKVNWVLQLDCPEDANAYIHRAGRTARFEHDGEALLVLTPSEEEHMVEQLKERKIPINKIRVNPKRLFNISPKLEALCASDKTLKEMAQRAFVSYLRSIFLMKNKKVFDVQRLDTEAFSKSLGLAIAPRTRFLKRAEMAPSGSVATPSTKQTKNSNAAEEEEDSDSDSENEEQADNNQNVDGDEKSDDDDDEESGGDDDDDDDSDKGSSDSEDSSEDGLKRRKKDSDGDVIGDSFGGKSEDSDSEDGELFTVKRTLGPLPGGDKTETVGDKEELETRGRKKKPLTKAAAAKRLLKKNITANTRIVFDDEGNAVHDAHKRQRTEGELSEEEDEGGINVAVAAKRMRLEDQHDKELHRQKIKQKHKEERIKKKERLRAERGLLSKKAAKEEEEESEDEVEAVLDSVNDGTDPFDFIPDPDELAARAARGDSSSEDDSESDDDRGKDNSRNQRTSSEESEDSNDEGSGDSGDDSDEGEESEEENENSVLDDEELALQLLKAGRTK